MSKNSAKRRADEDAIKELASPLDPIYAARREAVKSLPRFWGTALAQHARLAVVVAGQDDMKALSHLTDLWVEYDSVEPRAFSIIFEFSENPYFSDKTLKKEYKYTPPTGTPAPGTNVDANGVSDAQEVFEWESHITPQSIKINWKDDAHNLTKLSPRIVNPEDPEDVEEIGSFFNWFEHGPDFGEIGPTIVQDIFPHALSYYRGEGEMGRAMIDSDDEMDSDEEDEEDDDDDEEEIDLEQPRKRRPSAHKRVLFLTLVFSSLANICLPNLATLYDHRSDETKQISWAIMAIKSRYVLVTPPTAGQIFLPSQPTDDHIAIEIDLTPFCVEYKLHCVKLGASCLILNKIMSSHISEFDSGLVRLDAHELDGGHASADRSISPHADRVSESNLVYFPDNGSSNTSAFFVKHIAICTCDAPSAHSLPISDISNLHSPNNPPPGVIGSGNILQGPLSALPHTSTSVPVNVPGSLLPAVGEDDIAAERVLPGILPTRSDDLRSRFYRNLFSSPEPSRGHPTLVRTNVASGRRIFSIPIPTFDIAPTIELPSSRETSHNSICSLHQSSDAELSQVLHNGDSPPSPVVEAGSNHHNSPNLGPVTYVSPAFGIGAGSINESQYGTLPPATSTPILSSNEATRLTNNNANTQDLDDTSVMDTTSTSLVPRNALMFLATLHHLSSTAAANRRTDGADNLTPTIPRPPMTTLIPPEDKQAWSYSYGESHGDESEIGLDESAHVHLRPFVSAQIPHNTGAQIYSPMFHLTKRDAWVDGPSPPTPSPDPRIPHVHPENVLPESHYPEGPYSIALSSPAQVPGPVKPLVDGNEEDDEDESDNEDEYDQYLSSGEDGSVVPKSAVHNHVDGPANYQSRGLGHPLGKVAPVVLSESEGSAHPDDDFVRHC
ncbi:Nucleosome assembly protein (NAP) [Rhizoctonia solani]|uniref:Nucleosome assembly protein (NAP) n=1 Tax=Rhizoctonia solani TaxID=456999 RepID=A0A8H7I508_9AGAM|nr:Nucleosome assembly protein (NAP) [Rhizoctonia solani]